MHLPISHSVRGVKVDQDEIVFHFIPCSAFLICVITGHRLTEHQCERGLWLHSDVQVKETDFLLCKYFMQLNVLFCFGLDYVEAENIYSQALRKCPAFYKKDRSILFSNRAAARLKQVKRCLDAVFGAVLGMRCTITSCFRTNKVCCQKGGSFVFRQLYQIKDEV